MRDPTVSDEAVRDPASFAEVSFAEVSFAEAGHDVAMDDEAVAALSLARTARVDVLATGYAGDRVASTVILVRDGDAVVVIDPGMVASRSAILDPLAALAVSPDQVTDVVLSHHHPDHTINIALFEHARVHDFWAIYKDDVWEDRPAEGFAITPSIRLIETPGHTPQDITTLIGTPDGVVAATHVWWTVDGPATDPFASDSAQLAASRQRVLALAGLVIPGHGAAFTPDDTTPR